MIAGQVSKLQFIEKFLAAAPKFLKAGQVAKLTAELAPMKAAFESDAVLLAAKAAGKTNHARETIIELELLVEAEFAAKKVSRADLYIEYVQKTVAKGQAFPGFEIAYGAQNIVVKDLADVAAGKLTFDKLKYYEQWKELFASIGLKQDGWEFHHLIEKQFWQKLMPGVDLPPGPAIPLWGRITSPSHAEYGPAHQGAGSTGLADRIRDIVRADMSDKQALDALKELYTSPEYLHLNMWAATRDWLKTNLPAVKKTLVPN